MDVIHLLCPWGTVNQRSRSDMAAVFLPTAVGLQLPSPVTEDEAYMILEGLSAKILGDI